MKWFLILWAAPLIILCGWYGLSYYDISFGFFMLTRDAHDLVFRIYGHVLGMEPDAIPPLVLRAIIVDSLIVLAIIAFRRRKAIAAWWRARRASAQASSGEADLVIRDSLSSASAAKKAVMAERRAKLALMRTSARWLTFPCGTFAR